MPEQSEQKWYNVQTVNKLKRLLRELMRRIAAEKMVCGKNTSRRNTLAFNMRVFARTADNWTLGFTPKKWSESEECGTTACALGWASLRISPIGHNEYITEYSSRLIFQTPLAYSGRIRVMVYDWLFDSSWARVSPGPDGVLLRLNWLIAHGVGELAAKNVKYANTPNWAHALWRCEVKPKVK